MTQTFVSATTASLGRSDPSLERIVAALERHLHRELVDGGALAALRAPGVGAVAAVWAVWQRLGLGSGSLRSVPRGALRLWSMRCSRWWRTGWWRPAQSGPWPR